MEPDVPAKTENPTDNEIPALDADGILRFGGRWVAVSETQIPVVELLVQRFGALVSNDDLLAAYGRAGGATTASALRPLVYRLRQRLGAVGLELHVVRRRGVLLDVTSPVDR